MAKFRKKPVVIDAFQLTEKSRIDNSEWPEWMNRAWNDDRNDPGSITPFAIGEGTGPLLIGTLEGTMTAQYGDWIIRGVNGELYPCKPDIFAKTYEPVD